jgi:hypothetical protein
VVHGQSVDLVLFAPPGASSVTLFDVSGGPSRFLGATYHLGLTAGLGVLDAGLVGTGGFRTARIPTSLGAPLGVPLYLQSVLISRAAAAVPSDGRLRRGRRQRADRGLRRSDRHGPQRRFDAVSRHVQASPARTFTIEPHGRPSSRSRWPAANAFGVRTRACRATDLNSTGDPATRRDPLAPCWSVADVFQPVDVAHSHVVPDYVVDVNRCRVRPLGLGRTSPRTSKR